MIHGNDDQKVQIPVVLKPSSENVVTLADKRALRRRQESVERVDAIRAASAEEIAERLSNGAQEEVGDEMFNAKTMRVERTKKPVGKGRSKRKSRSA